MNEGQQMRLLPGSGGYRKADAAKSQTNPGGGVAWPASNFFPIGHAAGTGWAGVPQGSGNAGIPTALDQVAAGIRGERGIVWVDAYGAWVDPYITEGQFALGVEGGGGTSSAGAAGSPIATYAQANLYPDRTKLGNSGGHGYGGNAPYQGGDDATYPSGGGGGGSSWVHPSVLDMSTGSHPNETTVGIDSSGYGLHGLVSITFSC